MGNSSDRPILEAILGREKRPAFLGVIGSKSKKGVLTRELKEAGIDGLLSESFECPVGLKIGSNQPSEIAISIAAQLLQRRDALRKE